MMIKYMILGIICIIVGAIMLFLRFKCDEINGLSWGLFIGGILITICGYYIDLQGVVN